MEPFFSVIVPVYNVEPYLRECIDSILGQSYADFELILVDDGSPDNCPMICDEYAHSDSRVSVIHKPNGGLVSARNAGIAAASGQYVCHADSDDYVESDWLQTIHDDIIENSYPDILVYNHFYDDKNGKHMAKNRIAPGYYDKPAMAGHIYPYMLYDRRNQTFESASFNWNVWTKPGKRNLYDRYKVLDERISVGEDAALIFDMMYAAESVFISDRALYHYRIRPDSIMTSVTAEKQMSSLRLVYEKLKRDLAVHGRSSVLSVDCWYAKQLIELVCKICKRNRMFDSAAILRRALKKTGCMKGLRFRSVPVKTGIFILPLKLKLPLVTVMMQKIIDTVYG